MHVAFVRVGDEFVFLVETIDPAAAKAALTLIDMSVGDWHPVELSALRDFDEFSPDDLDLCRFAYGNGFHRGIEADRWNHYRSVRIVRGVRFGQPTIDEVLLTGRLVEEMSDEDNPMAHLLGVVRAKGESHGKNYARRQPIMPPPDVLALV